MKIYKIKSYCKVNLYLRVTKKLNNGYHSISSLITFCNLYDTIFISKINSLSDKISFTGKFKKGINKKSNIVTKVLSLLRKKQLIKNETFKISIQKNIPHGSGLGGASSNAASLLNFFNYKRGMRLKKNKLKRLAAQIGFDVPINLERMNTFLSGKGNKILRLNRKLGLNLIIIYPNFICSTKKIFRKNKTISNKSYKYLYYIKNRKKLINLLKNEKNDLEKTVTKIYPKIQKIINYIKSQNGCYFSRITGSGSACIGIFSSMASAISAQKLIKSKYPKYWCVVSKTM